jgi:nucleoside phosphorylase
MYAAGVSDQAQAAPPECEYLLLVATTTEQEELEKAAASIKAPWRPLGRIRGQRCFDLGYLGHTGGSRVLAVRVAMGPQGATGSAASAFRYPSLFRAQGMICLGMAFGLDKNGQAIGDVLVSTGLAPYDNRDVLCDSNNTPCHRYNYGRVHLHPAQEPLLRIFERRKAELKEQGYRVHLGSMLTGASRLGCESYRDSLATEVWQALQVQATKPDALGYAKEPDRLVGGEMEGAGFLAACPRDSPNWIIVKGVSDFADGKDARDSKVFEANRELACHNAATFVLTALAADNRLRSQD